MFVNEKYLEELSNKYIYQKQKFEYLLNYIDKLKRDIDEYFEKMEKKLSKLFEINEQELKLVEKIINSYKLQCGTNVEVKENLINLANIQEMDINFEKLNSRIVSPLQKMCLVDEFINKNFYFINSNEPKKEIKEKKYNIQNNYITLKNHKFSVEHLCILNDGRLSSSSADKSLIIYSKECIPMITIKDEEKIYFHIQLKNGNILYGNHIGEIKVIKLNNNSYELIQKITGHSHSIKKVLELKDGKLISCSRDGTLKIWELVNGQYKCIKTITISDEIYTMNIVHVNDNEFALSVDILDCVKFFESNKNYELISEIKEIKISMSNDSMCMTKEGILIVGSDLDGGIYLIDTLNHILIAKILEDNICRVNSLIQLNNGNILAGGKYEDKFSLVLFKIENNNLIEIEKNDEAHKESINCLVEKEDGTIISCSNDKTIKFWG